MKAWIVRVLFFSSLLFIPWVFPKITHGFRLGKLGFQMPNVETATSALLDSNTQKMLTLPLYFLGHGKQSYVFESSDGTFVIKIFRKALKPNPIRCWIRFHLLGKKKHLDAEKKSLKLLNSARIAFDLAPDLTSVFFAHLSDTNDTFAQAILIDRLGRSNKINLNKTRFVLQKKGVSFSDAMSDQKNGEKYLDQFILKVRQRAKRKIKNSDVKVAPNFGLVDGQIVEWDVGNFIIDDSLERSEMVNLEADLFFKKMKKYLKAHAPHHLSYFEMRVDG